MYRTRFKKEILAEFLPPSRPGKKQKVIILCDGMPSIPRRQSLAEFLSKKGYWVFYPRYRGSWESDGVFLKVSPAQDISDMVDELLTRRVFIEAAFGQKFKLIPDEIFVIGGSFGGATALMASLDKRIKKVIANCPVVDWSILDKEAKAETSNENYVAYVREAFGNGYRFTEKEWNKLRTGKFFNPVDHLKEFDPNKAMIFHAKNDPYIPWKMVEKFSKNTGIKLNLFKKGGHISTVHITKKYWPKIKKFMHSR